MTREGVNALLLVAEELADDQLSIESDSTDIALPHKMDAAPQEGCFILAFETWLPTGQLLISRLRPNDLILGTRDLKVQVLFIRTRVTRRRDAQWDSLSCRSSIHTDTHALTQQFLSLAMKTLGLNYWWQKLDLAT